MVASNEAIEKGQGQGQTVLLAMWLHVITDTSRISKLCDVVAAMGR